VDVVQLHAANTYGVTKIELDEGMFRWYRNVSVLRVIVEYDEVLSLHGDDHAIEK
jgi:hypothetical protein